MKNLQSLASQSINKVQKEKFESMFYKVLLDQTFKKNQEKDQFLRQQFNEDNEELLGILALHD